jgi:lactoylglutathione lyase
MPKLASGGISIWQVTRESMKTSIRSDVVCGAQDAPARASINHTAIFVIDIKKSAAFYKEIFGLDTIPEPFKDGKHVWLRTGPGVSLHIIEGATAKKEYFKNQHTCFGVASVESFVEVLKKNKIAYEDVRGKEMSITTRPDGIKQIWLQDPDGYWIEVNDARD